MVILLLVWRRYFFIEQKAWRPDTLKNTLKGSLRFTATAATRKDEVGQMLRDIVDYKNNGNEFRVSWEFSPEMAAGFTEEKIAETIIDLLKSNEVINSNLRKVIGDMSGTDYERFIKDLTEDIGDGFIRIDDLAEVKSAIDIS